MSVSTTEIPIIYACESCFARGRQPKVELLWLCITYSKLSHGTSCVNVHSIIQWPSRMCFRDEPILLIHFHVVITMLMIIILVPSIISYPYHTASISTTCHRMLFVHNYFTPTSAMIELPLLVMSEYEFIRATRVLRWARVFLYFLRFCLRNDITQLMVHTLEV